MQKAQNPVIPTSCLLVKAKNVQNFGFVCLRIFCEFLLGLVQSAATNVLLQLQLLEPRFFKNICETAFQYVSIPLLSVVVWL